MLSSVKGWAGVGAMFVRDPLQVLTFAVLRRGTPDHDSQRAEWLRERDEEIDRAYELRRRQGMSDPFAEKLWSKENSAKWAELDERFRQGIYPYGPRERSRDIDDE
jgi:hypothetical protein